MCVCVGFHYFRPVASTSSLWRNYNFSPSQTTREMCVLCACGNTIYVLVSVCAVQGGGRAQLYISDARQKKARHSLCCCLSFVEMWFWAKHEQKTLTHCCTDPADAAGYTVAETPRHPMRAKKFSSKTNLGAYVSMQLLKSVQFISMFSTFSRSSHPHTLLTRKSQQLIAPEHNERRWNARIDTRPFHSRIVPIVLV